MNDQPSLFDQPASLAASLAGMEIADQADRVQMWKLCADAWLAELPVGSEFTADDLAAAVGLPDQGANRNNVVGAWVNSKSRTGKILFANRLRKSERVTRHVGLQRVWIVA